jgi:uncharacterized membrane-anchored protein
LLNKVPEVTVWFWLIKVLCTTVGETAADFLNATLGFGLTGTSIVTGALLAIILALQMRSRAYVPGLYWGTVTLVSVFGTLVTDNLTDNLGVPLELSSVVFGVALAIVFVAWYRYEGTLSIHSIITTRRETFYWLAIFVTFALGTATGDLMAQALSLGYVVSAAIVMAVIAVIAIGWRLGLHPVLSFWILYVLTRPLGASLGDLLAQPTDQGGLGVGSTVTSIVFLVAILGMVTYLSLSRVDVIDGGARASLGGVDARTTSFEAVRQEGRSRYGLAQTLVVVAILLVLGGVGYAARLDALAQDTGSSTSAAATPQAQGRLQARDEAAWTRVDGKVDTVLTSLRASSPDPAAETTALNDLLAGLG